MIVGGCCGQVSAVITRYTPRSLTPAAAGFAREIVAQAAPQTQARAKALLFAASKLAGFAESVGLELDASVLLSGATLERFILVGCPPVTAASRRTLRANLRSLARALERCPEPLPVPLGRERAKQPYSPAQIDGFLRLADAQATHARRLRAGALICLGAGAGVIAGELRHVRGSDIVARSGGVIVLVPGRRARSVPVLEHYHERLLTAAVFAGDRFVIGGRNPERHNVTDRLTAALCTDVSLGRLHAGRLRSTWLTQCATRIGLQAFMQAAGIHCSQRLGDLAASLPALSEQELVALLGGSP